LGYNYSIANIDVWNFNHPDSLNMGIKDAYIDISLDGVTWTNMGQFTVPQANGSTLYAGAKAIHTLGLQPARYILITPTTNYGGGNCYGMAEVQFNLSTSFLPVTITDVSTSCLGENALISWKSEEEKDIISYEILASNDAASWSTIHTLQAKGSGLYEANLGQNTPYYLRVQAIEQGGKLITSDIVVNECSIDASFVTVKPNPFTQQFTVSLTQSTTVQPNNIRILDLSGREVFSQTLSSSNASYTIQPPNLLPGVYFAEVNMFGEKKYVIRVVKI
jgi:hypothetical protein